MRFATLVLVAALGVLVAARSSSVSQRDPAIEALLAEAASLPPEFSADIILRLAALAAVGADWKRDLLDDAFVQAHGAPDPFRVTMPTVVRVDSRQGARVRAAQAGLDRVSLGARAAMAMAALDPERGREMFEAIDVNREPVPCREALVPDLDIYYTGAALIARRRYPAGGPDASDALSFFGYFAWRARLAGELPSVVKAILRFGPSRDEALFLDSVLRVGLERGVRDPRGLSVAGTDAVQRIGNLADVERALAIQTGPLLGAFRQYLAGQLSAGRCADDVSSMTLPETFNEMLVNHASESDNTAPLPAAAGLRARVLDPARVDLYWQSGDAFMFRQRVEQLAVQDRKRLTLAERLDRDWLQRAVVFLDDFEQWRARRDVDDADGFYQKQMIAGQLLELAPTLDLQLRALRIMIEEQRHAAAGPEWRSRWFVPAAGVVEIARGREELLDALERSGEPVLALYAKVERVAPKTARRRAD